MLNMESVAEFVPDYRKHTPLFRWLVADRSPKFDSKPGCVGYVVENVAMGQVLLQVLGRFPC